MADVEKEFLTFCKKLEVDLQAGNSIKYWPHLAGSSAVNPGEYVSIKDQSQQASRAGAKKYLEYIRQKSEEFPNIAKQYCWALNEAILKYENLVK